ncbi:MAG TPA: hypothetical protein DCP25_06110 [Chloroflexi bacterium]|nr:hypothetical protein [Chloroflexota bacterium]
MAMIPAVAAPSLQLAGALAATVAGFVVGGVWFAPPVFGKSWLRALTISDQDAAKTRGPNIGLASSTDRRFLASLASRRAVANVARSDCLLPAARTTGDA